VGLRACFTLIKLADEKKLHEPAVLSQQIERLLRNPKSQGFIESFTDQWLKLNQIDFTTPNTLQFRAFATHFLTYSAGAPPRSSQGSRLDAIVPETQNMRSIIREVVMSEMFFSK